MRYDYFRFAVSGVGDVNGDWLENVIISAITGKVCYVIYGRSTGSGLAWPNELKMADVVSGETGETERYVNFDSFLYSYLFRRYWRFGEMNIWHVTERKESLLLKPTGKGISRITSTFGKGS